MLKTIINGIKNTIPSDSKTIAQEDEFRQPKRREMVLVTLNGKVAERIHRIITAQETEISYAGDKYPLRGSGFERFIEL